MIPVPASVRCIYMPDRSKLIVGLYDGPTLLYFRDPTQCEGELFILLFQLERRLYRDSIFWIERQSKSKKFIVGGYEYGFNITRIYLESEPEKSKALYTQLRGKLVSCVKEVSLLVQRKYKKGGCYLDGHKKYWLVSRGC